MRNDGTAFDGRFDGTAFDGWFGDTAFDGRSLAFGRYGKGQGAGGGLGGGWFLCGLGGGERCGDRERHGE